MKVLFFHILTSLVFVSCSNYKSNYTKSDRVPFSKKDLNILVTAVYIKKHHQNCKDTCKFLLNSDFKFYNSYIMNCSLVEPYLRKSRINLDDSLEIHSDYNIEGVGEVSFNKFKNKLHYSFSPVIYIPEHKLIICQVKNNQGIISVFTCKLVGNKIYFSEEGNDNFCPNILD